MSADARHERALEELARMRLAWANEAQRADRLAVVCGKLRRLAQHTRDCSECQSVAEDAEAIVADAVAVLRGGL